MVPHDPPTPHLFEQHQAATSASEKLKKQIRTHVDEEEFEEAAACKKKVKANEAKQKEIRDQVTKAIDSFIKINQKGAEETVESLSSKEVL